MNAFLCYGKETRVQQTFRALSAKPLGADLVSPLPAGNSYPLAATRAPALGCCLNIFTAIIFITGKNGEHML